MPYANRFLASLSPDQLALLGELEPIELVPGEIPIRRGDLLSHYIFVDRGFLSAVAIGPNGRLDLGILPAVGFCGATGFTTSSRRRSVFDYIVRVPGQGYRLPARQLHIAVEASSQMRDQVRRVAAGAAATNALNAVCQARHATEHRCARYWLTIRDGVGSNLIRLPQSVLAEMLAVTRQVLSRSYGNMVAAGAIEHMDGSVMILNAAELARRACECYSDWRAITDEIFIA